MLHFIPITWLERDRPFSSCFMVISKALPHHPEQWRSLKRSREKVCLFTNILPHMESESGRQARPVSQSQILQRELHMKFSVLFSSAFVPRLAIPKQTLNDPENVLDFCTYG